MPRVTFMPDGVTLTVSSGESLLRAAMMADVGVSASCGGDGTCGKCRMVVEHGKVDGSSSTKLTTEQVEKGYVLACLSSVTEDVAVRIPIESLPGAAPVHGAGRRLVNTVLSAEDHAVRLPPIKLHAPIFKAALDLQEPDLTDNAADATRVRQALRRGYGVRGATISLDALRRLPSLAREGGWTVTAFVAEPCEAGPCISGFHAGDTSARQFSAAVDIGTTTVEVALIDVVTGHVVARHAAYNAQVSRGEDVITRVIAADSEEGLEELHGLAIKSVSDLIALCFEEAGADPEDLVSYVTAGNTVMTHLLLGISPASIRTSPYVPPASSFPWVRARSLGLPGSAATRVVPLPCPASWLGGDVVAGVVAAGIPWRDKLTLFIDVGTNGEIVLGNSEWLVSCSCSAGPAFEGGGIRHGMRAAEGAIEQVRIDPATLEPSIMTIGSASPIGICGSGLIDTVCDLFLCGAIDRTGKFAVEPDGGRIRDGEHGREYVLVHAGDSGTGHAITLGEVDIDNLMRAKAAIYAGICVLIESLDVTIGDISEVVVAGGFGHYLDLERVTALGMVPEMDPGDFVFLGNGSLLGATLCVRSREMLEQARSVAEMMTYLELSVNAGFMDHYVSALFLPHTDLSAFPRTEALRAQRSGVRGVS
ncbi:MAG: ASKHA domain-containing protein [Coriobacteriia bacterium]